MDNGKSNCSIVSQSIFTADSDEDYEGWLQRSLLDKVNNSESTSTPVSKDRQIIIENLIEAVRAQELLWNVGKSEYKDRDIRPKLWKEVARELNYSEQNYLDLRKKWSMIKAAYGRSKIGAPSGSGGIRKPYKFGRLLSFLDDTCQPRAEISTIRSVKPSTPSPAISEISTCGSSSQVAPSRSEGSSDLKRRALEILESRENKALQSEDYFGHFVTAELLKIPDSRRSRLQLEIMQCICKARSETDE